MHFVTTHTNLDTIIPVNFAHYRWEIPAWHVKEISWWEVPSFNFHFFSANTSPTSRRRQTAGRTLSDIIFRWTSVLRRSRNQVRTARTKGRAACGRWTLRRSPRWTRRWRSGRARTRWRSRRRWCTRTRWRRWRGAPWWRTTTPTQQTWTARTRRIQGRLLQSHHRWASRPCISGGIPVPMAFIVFPKGTPRRPGRNMTLGLTQLSLFQGSQGYGSTESDFVDIEGFSSTMPDTSLPELNLQVGYAHK